MFMSSISARSLRAVAAAALVALGAPAVAQASTPAAGQVSLVIGEAHVVRADGSREAIRRGASIMVGDRVETAGNGHVHVRFIDNGVVSVRPESVLEVQAYRYDAQNPAANEVRLRLDQGASRSISGAATEFDKSRFRLNTPIAAIGVRGTDFIVQADTSGVRATVADGAIIIGPLAGDCSAGALGPCGGEASRVLSAGMGSLVAEVRPGDARTRLVPTAGTAMAAAAGKHDDSAHHRPQGEALTYSINDHAAADLLTIAKDHMPGLNRPADPNAAMVWGRWSGDAATGSDKTTLPLAVASVGRHYTGIGDSEMDLYLFRSNQTEAGSLLSSSLNSAVDFRLSRASAIFESGKGVETASIDGGSLRIDFARRTFATGLLLSAPSAGSAELRVAGDVRNNGVFAVKDNEQLVRGAVAVDGKEAGYLFERSVSEGLFKGHTLWLQKSGN